MSIEDYQFSKLTPEERYCLSGAQVRNAVGLVTEEVLAEVLGLKAVSTLATWRSRSEGPKYVKLGKGVFYTTSTIATWVNEQLAKQLAERVAA